ncbi:MAG: transglycosylase SLT domain-containing protein [Desulfatitalea sp.]
MNPARTAKAAGLLALLVLLNFSSLPANTDPFPIPEVIAPNVAFWTKVYATYTTCQGIVHDNEDLNITYEVIDLLPYNAPGADRTNRRRMKQTNEKYEQILKRLAQRPDHPDPECQRVAALFAEPRIAAQFRQAADRVRCQIGQKDRFQDGLVRSGAYIDQIRSIFKSYELPEDLAYLPHVESSFNPQAYSKSGAAGMWQFTNRTGKRFMQVGYAVDERRDPISATYAAAQLLKENYAQLGDWPLALTAYNHGTGGMQRAKALHGGYAQVYQSYQSRSFKFASRNFYSEFLAARHVASNHQEYFPNLALDSPVPYRIHKLDGFAPFAKLSEHFGIDPQTLKQLNPALRQPVLGGQKHVPKGYALRLPEASERVETVVAAAIPEELYHDDQKPSLFYTVQPGDTASKVARSHGVEVAELALANNLDRRATVFPHQTLRIPARGERPTKPVTPVVEPSTPILVAAAETPAVAQALQKAEQPVETVEQPVLKAEQLVVASVQPAPKAEEPLQTAEQPVVKVEQPVLKAERPAQTVAQAVLEAKQPAQKAEQPAPARSEPPLEQYPQPMLASVIPLPRTELGPASPLTIEALRQQASNDQIVTADVGFERILQVEGRPVGVIQVEIEETLGHYAEWADVRTQQIRNLNGLSFSSVLQLHQKIKIPLHRVGAQAFEQNRYEFHKSLQEDFFAVYRIGELQDYSVQNGDNYWTLCQTKFAIPMWLLKHCNPEADLADLHIQQKLIIPIIEKASADDVSPADEQEIEEEAPSQTGGEI